MSRTDPRLSRRSFVSASLASFVTATGAQTRQSQAARMTPMGETWSRLFLWCGLTPSTSSPAAA